MEGTRLDLCSSFGFIIDFYSSQGREGLGRGVGGGNMGPIQGDICKKRDYLS